MSSLSHQKDARVLWPGIETEDVGRFALSSVSHRGLTVRLSPLTEGEMHAVILAFVGGAALAAASAQAAPLATR